MVPANAKNYETASIFVKVIQINIGFFFPDKVYKLCKILIIRFNKLCGPPTGGHITHCIASVRPSVCPFFQCLRRTLKKIRSRKRNNLFRHGEHICQFCHNNILSRSLGQTSRSEDANAGTLSGICRRSVYFVGRQVHTLLSTNRLAWFRQLAIVL